MSKELDERIKTITDMTYDAFILANNVCSPQAKWGCFQFELCEHCSTKGGCLCYHAKKFLEKYKEEGVLV